MGNLTSWDSTLNDLCVLAPPALVDASIRWTPIDPHHARTEYSNAQA
jgi:hypothetical protein